MITELRIDKSGRDIFEKDYSIAILKDNEDIYGVNIPQNLKDKVLHEFNEGKLWVKDKRISEKMDKVRLKIRFHSSVICCLIEKILFDNGKTDKITLLICNDFDGHFHEIQDMLYTHVSRLVPSLKKEDILITKFLKPNALDSALKDIRSKNKKETQLYNLIKINEEKLINLIKK